MKFYTNRPAGFTLIELMIVVSIISIIMAIAIPSYNSYVGKSRCAQAQADLLELAQWMERRYSSNFDYRDTDNAPPNPDLGERGRSPRDTTKPLAFNITFAEETARASFKLQAVPTSIVSSCETMTIDETGAQTTIDADNNETPGW